ncbi:NIPA-like protein 2 isoform X2 [Pristis pectinata]|uniref:NIPA-like protein 2 isoform X2 n=1 Tax=Pristis pectinata TaxID=685728 RepID=UPI00223D105C|nr:NIPA-like protein 2 isoform X2 [Pristis pectinata]
MICPHLIYPSAGLGRAGSIRKFQRRRGGALLPRCVQGGGGWWWWMNGEESALPTLERERERERQRMATTSSVITLRPLSNATQLQLGRSTISPAGTDFHLSQTNILGTILAITGNILISISLNIQKYTHVRLLCQESLTPYYKSKLWWCGIFLMGLGELGNFAAYGFAPATLVAPLGCVSVIASAAISVVFLKEKLRSSDILGGSLAVLGTYLLVTFAISGQQAITAIKIQNYIVSWEFLVYLTLEFLLFSVLLYLNKRRHLNHIVILLLMSSLLASLTVISVKAVAGMVTTSIEGQLQLQYPIFYLMIVIMIVSCIFQVQCDILSGVLWCCFTQCLHVPVWVYAVISWCFPDSQEQREADS